MKIVQQLVAAIALLFSAVSAQADEMKKDAALGGYCPVAYVAVNKALKGKVEYAVKHDGKTYLFVNADAKKAFEKEPDKFLPEYDGYCAYGMSLGKKFESDPTVFTVIDGRVFLNKNEEVGKLFAKGTAGHIKKADAEWKKMK